MGRCCRSHKVNASVLLPLLEELQIISVFICLRMMATNYIGAFSLRKLLLPLLRNSHVPSSRVVYVTSFTHRSGDHLLTTNGMFFILL